MTAFHLLFFPILTLTIYISRGHHMNIDAITELVKSKLSQKRFQHTLAVSKLAQELAIHYQVNTDDALWASILHDITKEEKKAIQLQNIKKSDIILDAVFYENENLHHGFTAYLFAKNELYIENEDVLNAIRYHTTGRENMSMLEKIIYVADACSYDRTYKEAEAIRKLSFEDIDESVFKIIEFTVNSLIEKRMLIAMDTISCYNSLLLGRGKRNESQC